MNMPRKVMAANVAWSGRPNTPFDPAKTPDCTSPGDSNAVSAIS